MTALNNLCPRALSGVTADATVTKSLKDNVSLLALTFALMMEN